MTEIVLVPWADSVEGGLPPLGEGKLPPKLPVLMDPIERSLLWNGDVIDLDSEKSVVLVDVVSRLESESNLGRFPSDPCPPCLALNSE